MIISCEGAFHKIHHNGRRDETFENPLTLACFMTDFCAVVFFKFMSKFSLTQTLCSIAILQTLKHKNPAGVIHKIHECR